jgi:hypothetical protein
MSETEQSKEQGPLMDALTYPVRGSGRILLVIGAVLSAVIGGAAGFSLFGFIALCLGFAYFNAFYFSIVESTVSGNDEPPDWPDISDLLGDMIVPMIRSIGVWLICMLPLIVMLAIPMEEVPILKILLVLAGLGWAVLYFPMAILNVIVSNEMIKALPHEVIPRIRAAMPSYLAIAGLLAAAFVVSLIVTKFLGRVPYLGGLLSAGGALYFSMAQARLAGTFYRKHLEEAEAAEREDV